MQTVLTSREVKLKGKLDNVSGLQIADLIANPCSRYLQCALERQAMTSPFGIRLVQELQGKTWITTTLP
jgi:hypothetical protein